MDIKERLKVFRSYIPAFFIAMKKKETPVAAKITAGITVVYALSPVDIIPDFIPVLGYIDDLIILPLMAALTVKLIPKELMKECLAEAEGLWDKGRPKKWYYAVPIIISWLLVIAFIVVMIS